MRLLESVEAEGVVTGALLLLDWACGRRRMVTREGLRLDFGDVLVTVLPVDGLAGS